LSVWSEVIWSFIVGKVGGETEGEVVIPARDPVAQVRDPMPIKPVFGKICVGEDADPSEMILDCLQVEVRIMTAGKVLKIGIGEGAGDGVEIDDVADHEPVVPGARLQAHGVFKRHCPHARRRCYLNRHPPGLQCLLEEIHLKFLTGAGKLQYQACVPRAGRFGEPHAVTRALERVLDMRRDFWQRGVVTGGKVQVLRWLVHDLMGAERVPSGQQQAIPFENRQAVNRTCKWAEGSPSRLTGKPA